MNTGLTRNQKFLIILLCMLIHASMMITVVGIKSKGFDTNDTIVMFESEREPLSHTEFLNEMPAGSAPALAQAPQNTPASAKPAQPQAAPPSPTPAQAPPTPPPLVALNGGGTSNSVPKQPAPSPVTPAPIPAAQEPESPQPSEPEPITAAQEPFDLDMFNETIARATQFLALENKPEKKAEKKQPEQKQQTFTKKVPAPAASPEEKQKITLAHITNRVLEQMAQDYNNADEQNDGTGGVGAAMEVRSKRRGPVSMQQIMYVNYCKKILSCIVTSYRIHKSNAPHLEQPRMACIKLALTSDGKIHNLSLAQSCGNPAIDHFLLMIFNDASSSFPPLPAALGQPLELPLFNISAVNQLQSAEYWFIQ